MPTCPVPSEDDWRSEAWDLDMNWSYQQLFGRTVDEVRNRFTVFCPLSVAEDVFSTPSRVFRYYIWAYLQYLVSPESKGEPDGANAFPRSVAHRASQQIEDFREIWPSVRAVLEHVGRGQQWYAASLDIYPNFRKACSSAIRDVEQLLNPPSA